MPPYFQTSNNLVLYRRPQLKGDLFQNFTVLIYSKYQLSYIQQFHEYYELNRKSTNSTLWTQ